MDQAMADAPWKAELRSALRANPPPTERALAEQFGVTRHALRRALAALRARGEAPPSPRRLSAAQPLRAATALLAEDTNPLEVLEIRLALEPALARLAALRATPAAIARIVKASSTPPGADVATADLAFHEAVATGARNGLAAALYGVLRGVAAIEHARLGEELEGVFSGARVAARDAEHRAVAEAIAARDPDAAEAAMRAHLQAVAKALTSRLTAFGS